MTTLSDIRKAAFDKVASKFNIFTNHRLPDGPPQLGANRLAKLLNDDKTLVPSVSHTPKDRSRPTQWGPRGGIEDSAAISSKMNPAGGLASDGRVF